MKKFSLFEQLETNLKTIENIYDSIKITLGPTGKNGILFTSASELKFITSGSMLLKSLEFSSHSSNVILKLFEQASIKTFNISGDGSTTTTLFSCQLLKICLKYLINGYNSIFLGNGLKKLAYFLIEKVLEFSIPVENINQLTGILKTSVGKKMNIELVNILEKSLPQIHRDGLILIEENISSENEVEIVDGIELDKGYASTYFVNDLKSFEVVYENPYILITSLPITSINQIREIIEYVKENNKPLVLIAEEINKDILSTLILNNIQKKLKIVVIKYTAIKFLKTGILEDLATLTHSNYFIPTSKNNITNLTISDLGQVEKAIIKKDKSTFILSKFSKVLAKRRINELNRELVTSESEDEKSIFKTRIARLSGHITKIKIGLSNKYEIIEQRQKVETAINTIRSSLEEGVVPGGGLFYLHLREEIANWSFLNLIGEEYFASNIIIDSLLKPFEELCGNNNLSYPNLLDTILEKGYPYGYDLVKKKVVNTFEEGLIDSAKSVRSILWNSLTIVCTMITSD
jgi:chaperonin GroEL